MQTNKLKAFLHDTGINFASLTLGVAGCIVISASAVYSALKLGALPNPLIFSALISLLILGRNKKFGMQHVNVAHTTMSAGSMIGGAVAFCIPALWIINPHAQLNVAELVAYLCMGVVIALLYTCIMRKPLMTQKEYKFPLGCAVAHTLSNAQSSTAHIKTLSFSGMLSAALFVARDIVHVFPQKLIVLKNFFGQMFALQSSPLMIALGYLIGARNALMLVISCLLSTAAVGVYAYALHTTAPEYTTLMRQSLGLGIMAGVGSSCFIRFCIKKIKHLTAQRLHATKDLARPYAFGVIALCLLISTKALNLNIGLSMSLMAVSLLAVIMAAHSVAHTGIDPLEVLALIAFLGIRVLFELDVTHTVLIICCIAVAAGLCGDVLNDFKAGYIMGTPWKGQLVGEALGALVGVFVASGVLLILTKAYGTAIFAHQNTFSAVQAHVVAQFITGNLYSPFVICGCFIGFTLSLSRLPAMSCALGVYVPVSLALTFGVGGALSCIEQKLAHTHRNSTRTTLIAAGIIGGEALAGVLYALYLFARISS